MTAGGIVLCGGKSTRMGRSKALLPFGPETMLQRVVRLLGSVVQPIVAVAAVDQALPTLPASVIVTRDERGGRGPLEGLRAGLKALPPEVEGAYVTSCDVPLPWLRFTITQSGSPAAPATASATVRPSKRRSPFRNTIP